MKQAVEVRGVTSGGEKPVERIAEGDTVCGPCHADADCYNSFDVSKRPGRILQDVAGYQNQEVILRIIEKLKCDEAKAQSAFEQMKQYLADAALAPLGAAKAPTREVDAAWHEFLMFTRDYAKFCREHFGFFIHHVPTPRLPVAHTGRVN